MVGPKPADPKQDAKRKWKGHGFNLIWRPNFVGSEGSEFGQKEFFLQLNLTDEELDFTEITGTGIANRSLFEDTITLGGIAYTQAIKDSFDQSGQHFEPGVWANVPQTANPRSATNNCPHGINSPRNDHQFAGHCNTFGGDDANIRSGEYHAVHYWRPRRRQDRPYSFNPSKRILQVTTTYHERKRSD